MSRKFRHLILSLLLSGAWALPGFAQGNPPKSPARQAATPGKAPVLIGLDGEYTLEKSTSAHFIELGIRVALEEINAGGGVLGGRPLKLETRDNRANPARGVANLKAFAAMKDMVAVYGGRFSPVVVELTKPAAELGIPLFAAWSSAEQIIDNGQKPNWVFRLALHDKIAMPAMIERARRKGYTRLGLLLANTSWGRSNNASAEQHVATKSGITIVGVEWYNWGEMTLVERYDRLLKQGAQAILLVANDKEGAIVVREVAGLPAERRVAFISHWGITGGDFTEQAGPDNVERVSLDVIQTFSPFRARSEKMAQLLGISQRIAGVSKPEQIHSPSGFGHAYDLTHILARAVNLAGSTDRAKVRAALEQVAGYDGLVRRYDRPFTAERHEALDGGDLFFSRYDRQGVLRPVE